MNFVIQLFMAIAGGDGWMGAAVGAVAGGIIDNIKGKEADNK